MKIILTKNIMVDCVVWPNGLIGCGVIDCPQFLNCSDCYFDKFSFHNVTKEQIKDLLIEE